jgi:uncharacterized protein YggE
MTLRGKSMSIALFAIVFCASAAQAQLEDRIAAYSAMQGGRPSLSAAGSAVVRRKPTQMRMYVQLQAKGKTLEEALAKLKDRREAVTAQLESLKADKKSIVFGAPCMSLAQSAQQKQIEAMVRAQMRRPGKKGTKVPAVPQMVAVTATLTAQWPLEGKTNEQLFVASHAIQEKIKAADIAGAKEKEETKVSAEEEELEEEAAQAVNRYGEQQTDSREPMFVFVATLAKADRKKAMADAFVEAKARAAELAKAAGVELGPLCGISGGCSAQSNIGRVYSYNSYSSDRSEILQQMLSQSEEDESPASDAEQKPDEAVGQNPCALAFTAYAMVSYQIGK